MTESDLVSLFEKIDEEDEFLKFERIENPLHHRSDLCAFLLLDRLVPGNRDMVCSARHDEIFLEVDLDSLAAVAGEDDVRTLVRCGVRLDGDGYLAMFV